MKILIDIPTDQYNEIVYVNYERLRDIVRDGVVIEKCEDAISREAVINLINHSLCDLKRDADKQIFINTVNSLPPVTPRTNLAETSQDCISRDDVDAYIAKLMSGYLYDEERTRLEEFSAYLWELPSVKPERPKGKWIFHKSFDDGHKNCNECIECNQCHTWLGYDCYAKTPYCPNCGAEMSGGDSE